VRKEKVVEKISFNTNVPVECRLAFLEGKLVPSNFGGNQYLFSTVDGKGFYVSEAVGNILHDQIKKLAVEKGEPIEICKQEVDSGRGRKSIKWVVSKVGFAPGEQPDGTFVVQAGAGAGTPAPANGSPNGKPTNGSNNGNTNGNGNGHGHSAVLAAVQEMPRTRLEDALRTVVAAVYSATQYAKELGYQMPPFTSEDIRTMANTLMIQNGGGRTNGGGYAA